MGDGGWWPLSRVMVRWPTAAVAAAVAGGEDEHRA